MSMRILIEQCTKCGACMMACPRQAIEEHRSPGGVYTYQVVTDRCDACRDEVAPLCRGDCPVPDCMLPVTSKRPR